MSDETQHPSRTAPGAIPRFDYSGLVNDAGPPAAPVPTIEDREPWEVRDLPRHDASFTLEPIGWFTVCTVSGRINERFPSAELGRQLTGKVVLDLSRVELVTSFGMRAWLDMLEASAMTEAYIVQASPAVVHQITMLRAFCGSARLLSLIAPYRCDCGEEFGVEFHAVHDRAALASGQAAVVHCRSCGGPAEMDEPPRVYFNVQDRLVDAESEELRWLRSQLGARVHRPPIETVLTGDTTAIRINGPAPEAPTVGRALRGAEGSVVLDLQATTDTTAAWASSVAKILGAQGDAVTSLSVDGAPLALAEALRVARVPHVTVRSVNAAVRTGPSGSRRVTVDLARVRRLAVGDPVMIPLTNRELIEVELEDEAQIRRLAAAFDPEAPSVRRRSRWVWWAAGLVLLGGAVAAGVVVWGGW